MMDLWRLNKGRDVMAMGVSKRADVCFVFVNVDSGEGRCVVDRGCPWTDLFSILATN